MPALVTPAAVDDGFIQSRILTIRGVQTVLSGDLAELYDVEVKCLHRQANAINHAFLPISYCISRRTSSKV